MRVLLSLAVLLLPLLGATSCSVILPADAVQCEAAEDCIARGFPTDTRCNQQVCEAPPYDPIWGCLGMVEEPVAVPGETHMYSQLVVDALTGMPIPSLTSRLCSSVDVNCDAPLVEDVPITADGRMEVTVISGFRGYFEMTADGFMQTLMPIGPIVKDSDPGAEKVQLARTVVVESVARTAGFEVDPTKGHILALLASCDGFGRAGVSFSHDPASGDQFYLIGLSPDVTAPASDESGNSGVFNMDPGFVTLTATLHETGEFIGLQRVLVRAGSMTYMDLGPSSGP
ncbi:MAG: hypothetical protein DRJ42_17885 [Deltaproteobacteria bacterium]|nr:MAG: hypothetical protein DRJ42_17885 [Deltaproteobacteria bacterium]